VDLLFNGDFGGKKVIDGSSFIARVCLLLPVNRKRPQVRNRVTRDRCYDFLNIFAEKFCEKIGVFDSKQSKILKKVDHNIGI
jgi:hypothetical protein